MVVELLDAVPSGVEEVMGMASGVTLLLLIVLFGTPNGVIPAERMIGAGRRGPILVCAHANPAHSTLSPASTNIMNLRISTFIVHPESRGGICPPLGARSAP